MWWPEQATSFCRFWLFLGDGSCFLTRMGVRCLNPADSRLSPIWYSTQKLFAINPIEEMVSTCLLENTSGPKRIRKRLHTAICCKLEFSWIIQGLLQVRINHFESSTVITLSLPWIIYKLITTSYMFMPKLQNSKRHQSFPICSHLLSMKTACEAYQQQFWFPTRFQRKTIHTYLVDNSDSFTAINCLNYPKLPIARVVFQSAPCPLHQHLFFPSRHGRRPGSLRIMRIMWSWGAQHWFKSK